MEQYQQPPVNMQPSMVPQQPGLAQVQAPQVAGFTVQQPVPYQQAVTPPPTMEDLFNDSIEDEKNAGGLPVGDFDLRITSYSWHIPEEARITGQAHVLNIGMPKFEFVVEGGELDGKKYNEYFCLKKGISARTGRPFNMERQWVTWLRKHGIPAAAIPVQLDPTTGIKDNKATYDNICRYIAQFGGLYKIERKKKKNSEDINTYFRDPFPILFDDQGNPLPKQLPPLPGPAASAGQPPVPQQQQLQAAQQHPMTAQPPMPQSPAMAQPPAMTPPPAAVQQPPVGQQPPMMPPNQPAVLQQPPAMAPQQPPMMPPAAGQPQVMTPPPVA